MRIARMGFGAGGLELHQIATAVSSTTSSDPLERGRFERLLSSEQRREIGATHAPQERMSEQAANKYQPGEVERWRNEHKDDLERHFKKPIGKIVDDEVIAFSEAKTQRAIQADALKKRH